MNAGADNLNKIISRRNVLTVIMSTFNLLSHENKAVFIQVLGSQGRHT